MNPVIFFHLGCALASVVVGVYAERKVSAFIQDRLGPMEVGKFGLLQLVADLLKLLQKEDIVPTAARRGLFLAAPVIVFLAIFAGYAVLPLSAGSGWSSAEVGVFWLMAIVSIDVFGILLAGWVSNNKYSLLGAMRAVAQMISYEVPLGLAILCVVVFNGTLNLQKINYLQGILSEKDIYFLGMNITQTGGFFAWNIFQMPLLIPVFVIFFIASLAECNRAPFDIPEAESELVGGFHTEYSGFRWAILFLSEYAMMLLVSFLGAILFFGGWNTPLPNIGSLRLADWTTGNPDTFLGNALGFFWLITKAALLIFMQMWVRWTYPRLRVDQLMFLAWKVLTPAALLLLVAVGTLRLVF